MAHILIIDDDPTIQLVLTKILQKQGYTVTTAKNGLEGIEKANQFYPALIICDWMMPILDGLEVCRRVKSNPELSTTFFILLTARDNVNDRVLGLDTGADDFLAKPIDLGELKARVRAGLRLHQASQDLKAQKQILEAELAEAAEYVQSLLADPLTEPISIHARFLPSSQLGGDCFDYYWLDPDYLAFYLLDVSGHGLGSALLSVTILNLLRSQALPGVSFYQPHTVLTALNENFQMHRPNDKYFTIWYGVYNRIKRQLTYASAGHPPAVLIAPTLEQEQQVQQLKTPNLPIGFMPDVKFTSDRCQIPAASILYLFSDGLYETNPFDLDVWNLDAFVHLLTQSSSSDLDDIFQAVRDHSNIQSFIDDASLLRVQFHQD